MKIGGKGGGNTITGLNFEKETNILDLLKTKKGYKIINNVIYYEDEEVAKSFKKYNLYKYLEKEGIDYKKILSKRLLPDDAIFVIVNNTIFILEVKFQSGSGSTDEKLQTCDFKIKQYRKLLSRLNVEVKYIYILSDWFQHPRYKDDLDYVISIEGCSYYFKYLPLQKLGLPVPKK